MSTVCPPHYLLAILKSGKLDKRPRHISVEEMNDLLGCCNERRVVGLRDRALLLLQFDTGIRPSEALKLTEDDIHWDGPSPSIDVRAEVSKTSRYRVLPLRTEVARALRRYIVQKHRVWPRSEYQSLVFPNQDGKPLTTRGWQQRLHRYSEKLGRSVTPYCLRHTAAIESLRNGANAFKVQTMLGHTTMNMTLRYIDLDKQDLIRDSDSWSPAKGLRECQKNRNGNCRTGE